MRSLLVLVLVVPASGLLAGCPWYEEQDPPCYDPLPIGAQASIELGRPDTGDDFVRLDDGAVLMSTFGDQGGRMISVRLRLVGGEVGSCAAPTLVAYKDTVEVGGLAWAVPVDDLPDGSHMTSDLFIVLEGDVATGDSLRVHAAAGGRIADRQIFLDQM
jgi:hypothetical protein